MSVSTPAVGRNAIVLNTSASSPGQAWQVGLKTHDIDTIHPESPFAVSGQTYVRGQDAIGRKFDMKNLKSWLPEADRKEAMEILSRFRAPPQRNRITQAQMDGVIKQLATSIKSVETKTKAAEINGIISARGVYQMNAVVTMMKSLLADLRTMHKAFNGPTNVVTNLKTPEQARAAAKELIGDLVDAYHRGNVPAQKEITGQMKKLFGDTSAPQPLRNRLAEALSVTNHPHPVDRVRLLTETNLRIHIRHD